MGLIGSVLQPLFSGARCLLMSPTAFLQRPARWLQAISRYGATTSGGPNFAYDLCARKVSAEERLRLDLSSWSIAFNGAEPVRAGTIERFAATFADCGFKRQSFYPCYGLAESTLMVSGVKKSDQPIVRAIGSILDEHRIIEPPVAEQGQKLLVSSGGIASQTKVIIVEPASLTECLPEQVGEVWVAGRSVALGYWNRPEETGAVFQARTSNGQGPFLRTGDLGFIKDGELFITGRLKDLIIIRGVNYYPQDIEQTVEQSHPALRPYSGAAFSVETGGAEQLVIVQEVERRFRNQNISEVIELIRQAIAEKHELQASDVVLVKPGSIPKTSSNKIKRHECRADYLTGKLAVIKSDRAGYFVPASNRAEDLSREALLSLTPEERQPLLESDLQAQLARLLRIDPLRLSAQQSLLSLGLDSLTSLELQQSVEGRLGVPLPLHRILGGLDISQLASEINDYFRTRASGVEPLLEGSHEDVPEHPLSYGQEALWLIHQLAPQSAAYNIASAFLLRQELNVPAFRRAFQMVVNRHAALRTTFTALQDFPVQRVRQEAEVCFRVEDARDWDETTLDQRLNAEARQPFDLERGPLLRVSLFQRSTHEYVLLFVAHHIVIDLWSLSILMHELGALYRAEIQGIEATLPQHALQYTDYVRWQKEKLAGEAGQKLAAYWKRQLAGELPTIALPTDRPYPPVQTSRGDSLILKLDAELTQRLRELSQSHDATLYMTLLAAFQTLLYRYTGQEEILIGSPTTGRNSTPLSTLVGYFVNPVVLRAHLSGTMSFKELLERVRLTVLEAFEHQDYPFDLLVQQLSPQRDPARSPLFQVMFTFNKAHLPGTEGLAAAAIGAACEELSVGGLMLEALPLKPNDTLFDLSLTVVEVGGSLTAAFKFNADLFDAATIQRMLGHFKTLLDAVSTNPAQSLATLPLLTAGEREQLLYEWNETHVDFQADGCVHEWFERQVERAPKNLAVLFKEQRLTYEELNARANQVAHHLRELGVRPEVLVGIYAERSLEMVIGLLGILKAGGAYVPLDSLYPAGRLAHVIEDARISILLTQQHLIKNLPESSVNLVCLDDGGDEIARHPLTNPSTGGTANNLAYIIYTSGSTGVPKGVAVEHQAVCNRLWWGQSVYPLTSTDKVLQLASFSFDFSVWEIFAPLTVGAQLVLVEPDSYHDSAYLVRVIKEQQISTIHFVPSMLQTFLNEASVEQLSSLKRVFSGGEVLSISLQERFHDLLEAELYNQYGPTEATIDVTFWLCQPGSQGSTVPIGRPVANTQIYILNERLEPVPLGAAGEIYIGGANLARSYLHRPDITAEKYLPNPFTLLPGARLYRTGDLARFLPDGSLLYLGRADSQVKIRGYRIELGEVEAVLSQHPGVREVAVTAREDETGNKALVAYLVAETEHRIETGEVRSYLKQRLPDYMIPSAFLLLDHFPLTPNGKLDLPALPAPPRSALSRSAEYFAARTITEELLCGIWAGVLKVERVGIDDNFFDLGGHSLLATQVISRMRRIFGQVVSLRLLFEYPRVRELAQQVERERRETAGVEVKPLRAVAREAAGLPLSYAQQRLWFLAQMEPESSFYNMPMAVRMSGKLNLEALERSLAEVIRRHESLRTSFSTLDEQPVQLIAEAVSLSMPLIDLSHLDEAEREARLKQEARAEAGRGFDLREPPLLRVRMLRLAQDEHVLLLTMHHIISDGWSMGVLVREVGALYEAYERGEESPLEELEVQYGDYAVWQRERLKGEELERELGYWREQLRGAPAVLELPTDRVRPPVQTYRGARQSALIPLKLVEALKTLSRREEVTFFMLLLAAFKTVLYRYTRQTDIIVGTPSSNRNFIEIESVIGFFVNMLVMRTDLSGNPTFLELLQRVKVMALEAYAHQDLPFEQLVEQLQPERSLSRHPLFQVLFQLGDATIESLRLPGLTLAPIEIKRQTTQFDLNFNLQETKQGLTATIEFSTDLFDSETISNLLRHWRVLLEGIVDNPARRISEFPLLTDDERHRVLIQWNDTKTDYPTSGLIHELFEGQVARSPQAVALCFDDLALSYSQLNDRADQLAHFLLLHYRLGPDSIVALCLDRSLDMPLALLAILKAGAAYLPLDPLAPPHRLAFMLAQSDATLLLTQSHLSHRLPPHSLPVLCLDDEAGRIAQHRWQPVPVTASPHNLAYVIYTSGSTGEPKGVMCTHGGVVNRLLWMQETYGLGADDSVLQKTPYSFDVSVWEFFWPLLNGGRLVMARPGGQMESSYLLETIAGQQVSIMHFVPSMLEVFVEEEEVSARSGSLRLVISSGEALSYELEQRFMGRVGARLANLYGPTEASIDVTYWECGRASEKRAVPIGRPIANMEAYVLDERMEPVGVGLRGELYLAGVGLARGYLHRPDLTAERFLPHPYSAEAGARLYRTGDVVRYNERGELEYVGRADRQVKVRGYRIELGEVEAALREMEGVREAAVVVREEEEGEGSVMVAYVVAETEHRIEIGEVRSYLKERLPEHMIPSAFLLLDHFPLTPNGKLDFAALPAPAASIFSHSAGYFAARTITEELLCGIWAEVLKVERVGIDDNFFDLGGHSLLATQVISRMRRIFGQVVSLRLLFEYPRVRELAQQVERERTKAAGVEVKPLRAVAREAAGLPLSYAQQRLWFLAQMEPESSFYNMPMAVRMSGRLNLEALERSLAEVIRRHESLRTSFSTLDEQPVQLIAEAVSLSMPLIDLCHLDEAEREARLKQEATAEAGRGFDLREAPLLRVKMLRLAQDEHVLLLTMHHIISDGWSMGVLVREVGALYEAYERGEESPLEELEVQYGDYAVWQRERLKGEELERELRYWREQLRGAPAVLELPTDRVRPAIESFKGARLAFRLPAALSESLRRLSREEGATLYMVLLGAFSVLLWRYSGAEDVVVGTPVANRTRGEVEGLIGFFVNTLVMRVKVRGEESYRELVRRVREVSVGGYGHQEVPFEKVVEELTPERSLSHTPLFQVMFALQNFPLTELQLPNLKLTVQQLDNQGSRCDLVMYLWESGQELNGLIEYNSDLFNPSTITGMVEHFQTLLNGIVADPEQSVSNLPLMSEAELRQLEEWGFT